QPSPPASHRELAARRLPGVRDEERAGDHRGGERPALRQARGGPRPAGLGDRSSIHDERAPAGAQGGADPGDRDDHAHTHQRRVGRPPGAGGSAVRADPHVPRGPGAPANGRDGDDPEGARARPRADGTADLVRRRAAAAPRARATARRAQPGDPRGRNAVKVTDVTLTLFAWRGIPSTQYGRHTGRFGGESQLGLLTVKTDAAVEGHAFLGSAMRGAHLDAASLIQYLKPVVLGQDPLERERLYQAMSQRSRATTLRAIGAMEELGFYWYEDPLADDDIYNYVKLKEQLHIPILATEYAPGGFTAFAPWIVARATDFLRGDVAVKGGITSLVKTAHLAEAFHMNFEVHHGGNSLNNLANLHVIMAIKNCEFFEVLLPAGAQKYGLVHDIEVDGAGFVHAPEGPGLGAAIDFALVERG